MHVNEHSSCTDILGVMKFKLRISFAMKAEKEYKIKDSQQQLKLSLK